MVTFGLCSFLSVLILSYFVHLDYSPQKVAQFSSTPLEPRINNSWKTTIVSSLTEAALLSWVYCQGGTKVDNILLNSSHIFWPDLGKFWVFLLSFLEFCQKIWFKLWFYNRKWILWQSPCDKNWILQLFCPTIFCLDTKRACHLDNYRIFATILPWSRGSHNIRYLLYRVERKKGR